MNFLDLLQWPAMAVTITASWMVASSRAERRKYGFWIFIVSNVLWIAWAIPSKAWALVVLQAALFAMNLRGSAKNDTADNSQMPDHPSP